MKREWLVKLRNEKNLTQKDISTIAFIDRSYYTQIENGKRNPSITVAKTIATALEFDPLLFFQDQIDDIHNPQSSINSTNHIKITDFFRTEQHKQILYINTRFDDYLTHLIRFILIGYDKGSPCFIFDIANHLSEMKKKLKMVLPGDDLKGYIHFINHEWNTDKHIFDSILHEHNDETPIYIWSRELQSSNKNTSILPMMQSMSKELKNRNIIFVGSYNASVLSAGSQIQLMRTYPILMTDDEIVVSPLYKNKDQKIFPPLFIQEE